MAVSDPGLDKASVLSPKREAPETRLPPAGDARREQLLKELDALNQRAEVLASQLGIERADPAKLHDHDAKVAAAKLTLPIGEHADVGIQGLRSDYKYACVWRDPFNRLANRVFYSYRKEGWEKVGPGMSEWDANASAQAGDGTLQYADTLLMRMPIAQWNVLERKRIALRVAREEGVPAGLLEAADRYGAKVTVGELPTEGGSDSIAAQAMRASRAHMTARRLGPEANALALELAQRKFNDALRGGDLTRR